MVEAGALNKKYGFATWFGPTNSYSPPQSEGRYGGTQFTCFTGTKVQILTHKALLGANYDDDYWFDSYGGGRGDGRLVLMCVVYIYSRYT